MTLGRSPERQRERQLADAPDGPLRDYLEAPFAPRSEVHTRLRLLAVDLETTGLDPERDEILSIGLLPVDGETVVLAGARQMLVRGAGDVGQSAAVHGLTDDAVAAGDDLAEALNLVLRSLTGRVLLAHHVAVEREFLSAACLRVLGRPLPCLAVDTMALERRLVVRGWGDEPPEGSLRLQAARDRHGLPRYRSHEALTDALACAELYLAQVAAIGQGRPVTLRRLMRR